MAKNNFYKKAEKFVSKSFEKIGKQKSIRHFKRTVYWVKKLDSKASEALLIAAMAHDIERAFIENKKLESELAQIKSFSDKKFLKRHQENCAKIIAGFLKKQKAGKKLAEKVKKLVSKHEIGGTIEQNTLKDADSISFFENNTGSFFQKAKILGKQKIREKFDWMYNRISSKKAKQAARKNYEKAIKILDYITNKSRLMHAEKIKLPKQIGR